MNDLIAQIKYSVKASWKEIAVFAICFIISATALESYSSKRFMLLIPLSGGWMAYKMTKHLGHSENVSLTMATVSMALLTIYITFYI